MYETLIGNQNAVKYSNTEVTNLLLDICDKTNNDNCYFILQEIRDKVSKGKWDYLTAKYQDNTTVTSIIKNIQSICERNLVEAMLIKLNLCRLVYSKPAYFKKVKNSGGVNS